MKRTLVSLAILSFCSTMVHAQEDKTFSMEGGLGFIFTTGNTETTSITASIAATQELEKWSNDYKAEGLYKQETVAVDGVEEDRTSAQKFFASAQGNYKLDNPNNRLFAFASYEDDRFSSYKYQSTIAAGWNQKVWDNKKTSFEYSVGPGYSFSKTNADESQNEIVGRASFAFKWLISDTAKFTQTASTEVGSSNTKSRAESALSATISGNLSMKLALKLDHNSDVAPGLENLDTETAVTLVYTFF